MTARFLVGDVFERLAELEDGSVDLVVTSPPFLALRSYLPADHPDKHLEIGSEATPAAFLDVMLAVTAELRRVLAPHGSIAIELGDTYSGSGGAGGDYNADGLREGQQKFSGSAAKRAANGVGDDWPLAKSKTLIPELYRIGLAYGVNPLTGAESPAGRWRVRNVVTWVRPNPPVGALGDKWRPATSDIVVACTSPKRYWDDLATRTDTNDSHATSRSSLNRSAPGYHTGSSTESTAPISDLTKGAPLLDWWVIPPGGYAGSHYAVYPPALVEPLVKAMCPERVCETCGEPSRRTHRPGFGIPEVIKEARQRAGLTQKQVAEWFPSVTGGVTGCVWNWENGKNVPTAQQWELLKDRLGIGDEHDHLMPDRETVSYEHVSDHPSGITQDATGRIYQRLPARKNRIDSAGWSDCGHDNYRPGVVLDPFGGSGTTGLVATGMGRDAILIDLDPRNAELATERVGGLLLEVDSGGPF